MKAGSATSILFGCTLALAGCGSSTGEGGQGDGRQQRHGRKPRDGRQRRARAVRGARRLRGNVDGRHAGYGRQPHRHRRRHGDRRHAGTGGVTATGGTPGSGGTSATGGRGVAGNPGSGGSGDRRRRAGGIAGNGRRGWQQQRPADRLSVRERPERRVGQLRERHPQPEHHHVQHHLQEHLRRGRPGDSLVVPHQRHRSRPGYNSDGTVKEIPQSHIDGVKAILNAAHSNGVAIDISLWSFDMLQSNAGNAHTQNQQLLENDTDPGVLRHQLPDPAGHGAEGARRVSTRTRSSTSRKGWGRTGGRPTGRRRRPSRSA